MRDKCNICGGDCGQCGGPCNGNPKIAYTPHPDQTSPMTVGPEAYLDAPVSLPCGCIQVHDEIHVVLGCGTHGLDALIDRADRDRKIGRGE